MSWYDMAGEARLARRVCRTRIVIILYIYSAGESGFAPTIWLSIHSIKYTAPWYANY